MLSIFCHKNLRRNTKIRWGVHQFFWQGNYIMIKIKFNELVKYEGKIYLAKDATLDELNFKKMYPNFDKWSKIVKELDPDNIFQSNQSIRLGLKNW